MKGLSQLYFLRRLRSLNFSNRMFRMFYQSVVASTIFYAAVCWGEGIKARDANRLNKLIKKAGSVIGSKEMVEDRKLAKLLAIMDNTSRPLHSMTAKQKSTSLATERAFLLVQDLYCHGHNNYTEAVVGNKILKSRS